MLQRSTSGLGELLIALWHRLTLTSIAAIRSPITKTHSSTETPTGDLVELLVKLLQLRALGHDVLAHEEGRHHGAATLPVRMVQGRLDQRLVQQNPLVDQVEAPAACAIGIEVRRCARLDYLPPY